MWPESSSRPKVTGQARDRACLPHHQSASGIGFNQFHRRSGLLQLGNNVTDGARNELAAVTNDRTRKRSAQRTWTESARLPGEAGVDINVVATLVLPKASRELGTFTVVGHAGIVAHGAHE